MLHDLAKYALMAVCLFCASTANAQQAVTIQGQKHPSAWFKAESRHVVMYADTTRDSAMLML